MHEKGPTLDPKEASMRAPCGPINGKLDGRKNVSKSRHGTAVSMLTARLRKRIAELDVWLRELERNRLVMTVVPNEKQSKAWNRKDAMPDNLSIRGQPDRSKIAMNEAFEIRYWTKHLGVSKEELQRAVDKVGNSAAAVKKELKK